jgi:citronellol/citronellal dehydrogenase
VLSTNLTGGFYMARECFTQGTRKTGSAIVNIVADMWGSMPGVGHSGAARAGMVSLTETAALEWAGSGVRVNAVAPGYIASSGTDNYPEYLAPMLREMTNTVPLGRFGTEAEAAAAIVFLRSPAAAFISGSTLRVDGARPQVRIGWPIAQCRCENAGAGFNQTFQWFPPRCKAQDFLTIRPASFCLVLLCSQRNAAASVTIGHA